MLNKITFYKCVTLPWTYKNNSPIIAGCFKHYKQYYRRYSS